MTTTEVAEQDRRRPLLAQMIAVERTTKQRKTVTVTGLFRGLRHGEAMSGLSRIYRPRDSEDTEILPSEYKQVQIKVNDVLDQVAAELSDLFDIVATRETGNTVAKADVVVGELVLLRNVPVTLLLFLENQLKDLATFMRDVPTLDPTKEWMYDPTISAYRSVVETTTRTKKTPKAFTRHPGTDKHAPQVDLVSEDVIVGFWDKTQFSGALPGDRVLQLQRRVEALRRAVKFAREQANATQIDQIKIGQAVFDYLLAP